MTPSHLKATLPPDKAGAFAVSGKVKTLVDAGKGPCLDTQMSLSGDSLRPILKAAAVPEVLSLLILIAEGQPKYSMLTNTAGFTPTTDKSIRTALKKELRATYKKDPQVCIIEELGITHGAARVDIAVNLAMVNGLIHGYELKSDLDSLRRLPDQMKIYNSVLDQMTLVVGKNHLHEAINTVPEWWGIRIAKIKASEEVVSFCDIRTAGENPEKDSVSIASLLWKDEALRILEEKGHAKGMRSKPRQLLYERLAAILDQSTLRAKVRECLSARVMWRSEQLCMQDGG